MSSYMVEIVEKSDPTSTLGILVSDFDKAKKIYDEADTTFELLVSARLLELTGDPSTAKILFEKSAEENG